MTELPIVPLANRAEWEAWLEAHPDANEVWVKLAKKGSVIPSVTYVETVEVALCFGWIDGQSRGLDETPTSSASLRGGRRACGRS